MTVPRSGGYLMGRLLSERWLIERKSIGLVARHRDKVPVKNAHGTKGFHGLAGYRGLWITQD